MSERREDRDLRDVSQAYHGVADLVPVLSSGVSSRPHGPTPKGESFSDPEPAFFRRFPGGQSFDPVLFQRSPLPGEGGDSGKEHALISRRSGRPGRPSPG